MSEEWVKNTILTSQRRTTRQEASILNGNAAAVADLPVELSLAEQAPGDLLA